MINYNQASATYDNTREPSSQHIQRFASRVPLLKNTAVLDFGCGTGNYLNAIQLQYGCHCCGVEPSDGMREIAIRKNPFLDIRSGNHKDVPFMENTFDFAFLTDVIHHIPDLPAMFSELRRVIKTTGLLCIVTESHDQIQNRLYNAYFPSLPNSERSRYPDIPVIVEAAARCGFDLDEVEILPSFPISVVSERTIRNAAEKNFSMLHYLDDREFETGLQKLREDLGKQVDMTRSGETLIWIRASAQRSFRT